MKFLITSTLSLASCLSILPVVNAVKCIMCDPKHEGIGCNETYIDCSKDKELGNAFDSCFTYKMVFRHPNESYVTHLDKNCSISDGCEELRDLMCQHYNTSLHGAVRSCDMHCCVNSDYCNLENFPTTRSDASTNNGNPTRSTTGHQVLGYKSTASTYTADKFKFLFGIFFWSLMYFMIGHVLL